MSTPCNRLRALALLAATALATGCTQPAQPVQTSAAASSAAPTTALPSVTASAPATHETLNPADQIKVVDRAESFLRTLLRPAPSRAAWWARIKPYLTSDAAQRLSALEPSAVGFARVNGSGQLAAETDQDRAANTRRVTVSTDAGLVTVAVIEPTGRRLVASYTTGTAGAATPVPSTPATTAPADAALKKFAGDFMAALVKPKAGVSARQWWERIATMLTDDAIDTYADITPEAVAARRVTGPITVERAAGETDDDAGIKAVTVGTDAGVYRLIVQLPAASTGRPLVMEIQEP